LQRNQIRNLPGYDLDVEEWENEDDFVPRYNIAPRTQAPVLRRRDGDQLVLQTMKWGLVPHWSKIEDKSLSTTNARSENLVEGGGMWGSLRGTKRCVIPVQGYVFTSFLDASNINSRVGTMSGSQKASKSCLISPRERTPALCSLLVYMTRLSLKVSTINRG
jgi:putative SOS response-associated peptidase YedK